MMTYNRFQGDPAVRITQDGAEMKFIGGQPVMDQGIENAALITLFTREGWWGNVLFDEESKQIGSDFEVTALEPVTDLDSINNLTDSATRAFAWMRTSKVAQKISVNVVNPRMNYLQASVLIQPPGQDSRELLFLKNGVNWISQAVNPAHERF